MAVQICYGILDYTSVPVSTTTWVELPLLDYTNTLISTGLPAMITCVDVVDSSGEAMELGVGATSASVVSQLAYGPNQEGPLPQMFSKGIKVFVKALDADATVGRLNVSFKKGK